MVDENLLNFVKCNINSNDDYQKIRRMLSELPKTLSKKYETKERIKKIIEIILNKHKFFGGDLNGLDCISYIRTQNIVISRDYFYRVLNLLKTKNQNEVFNDLMKSADKHRDK